MFTLELAMTTLSTHATVVWEFENDYKRPSAHVHKVFLGATRFDSESKAALYIANELVKHMKPGRLSTIRAALAYVKSPTEANADVFVEQQEKMTFQEDDYEHETPSGFHFQTFATTDDDDATASAISAVEEALAKADAACEAEGGKAKSANGAKRAKKQ